MLCGHFVVSVVPLTGALAHLCFFSLRSSSSFPTACLTATPTPVRFPFSLITTHSAGINVRPKLLWLCLPFSLPHTLDLSKERSLRPSCHLRKTGRSSKFQELAKSTSSTDSQLLPASLQLKAASHCMDEVHNLMQVPQQKM